MHSRICGIVKNTLLDHKIFLPVYKESRRSHRNESSHGLGAHIPVTEFRELPEKVAISSLNQSRTMVSFDEFSSKAS